MIPRQNLLALALLIASAAPRHLAAQTNGSPAPQPSDTIAQPPAPASDAQKPSSLIAPAVDHLSQVVSQVQLERWKASSRDDTDSLLRSVERNVSGTLPQLVTAADAQPTSVAAALPLLRNLDALCAVMIRVSVAARANAPAPQAESIAGALTAMQSARNSFADQVQAIAAAQEKQLASLENTVSTLTARASAPPTPPSAAPVPKTPPKKKKKAAKVAPKPAQTAASPPAKPVQQH